jgi:hypothetical protein
VSVRDVDVQKVMFCCTCPMIEIWEMQPPTSFEMKKTITTITAKFVLIAEGQKMKREVVWPKTKKQNTRMIDIIVLDINRYCEPLAQKKWTIADI